MRAGVAEVDAAEDLHDPVRCRGNELVLHGARDGRGVVDDVAAQDRTLNGVQRRADAVALVDAFAAVGQ
eukprot:5763216-Lingulodinium_polyedra.AAC.1